MRLPFWRLLVGAMLLWGFACQSPEAQPQESQPDRPGAPRDSVSNDPLTQLKALHLRIQEQPRDYGLYLSRSELYYRLDSLSAAVADAEQALKRYPDGADLHYWRGFLAYAGHDTALAYEELRQAQKLGSKNPEVPYQLGQIFFLQEKYGLAREAYRRAAQLGPYDPQYIFAQGFLAEEQGQYDRAVQLYKQSLGIDSTFTRALTRLHDVYLDHYENEAEAMKYNAQLLKYHPRHPLGRFQQGNYHLRQALGYSNGSNPEAFRRHINDAVLAYTITVNKDPNLAQAWYNRGFCYFLGEGRMNEAIRDFERAIEADRTQAAAHFMLGSIAEKNGDYRAAMQRYETALSLKPESQDFRQAVQAMQEKLRP